MDRATVEHALDTLRTGLGEDNFATAWAAGFALTAEEAIAEALQNHL
jgi:hypothetical protein